MQAHRLVIVCPDRHGIVAAVSRYLYEAGANIVSSDQHSTDPEDRTFFMRMEFALEGLERERFASADFLAWVRAPVINIHHSFLPAFAGADPYARARERGVKIIGATAHSVTEELDAGPIIDQDVVRVTHRDDVEALARMGRDIERTVLARAVRLHLDDRVLVHAGTTVVF